eukprot:TRINITY_DN11259_c0_g1_i1.p2 TRINITY_DN11259_c0_g1~~TRINITY_DN11259_c0_g1_i1.p2  ORF type:complete len:111 (+),score=31.88 TRINITY_DN11259_c0_g1_i1:561-893(+)
MTRGWEQRSAAMDVIPNAEEAYVKFITEEQAEKKARADQGAVSEQDEPQDLGAAGLQEEEEVNVDANRIIGLGRSPVVHKAARLDAKPDHPTSSPKVLELAKDPLKESLL